MWWGVGLVLIVCWGNEFGCVCVIFVDICVDLLVGGLFGVVVVFVGFKFVVCVGWVVVGLGVGMVVVLDWCVIVGGVVMLIV